MIIILCFTIILKFQKYPEMFLTCTSLSYVCKDITTILKYLLLDKKNNAIILHYINIYYVVFIRFISGDFDRHYTI